jgi:hypothetical protein
MTKRNEYGWGSTQDERGNYKTPEWEKIERPKKPVGRPPTYRVKFTTTLSPYVIDGMKDHAYQVGQSLNQFVEHLYWYYVQTEQQINREEAIARQQAYFRKLRKSR